MATTYKKNNQNIYKVPLYAQFWAWWCLVLGLALFSWLLGRMISSEIVKIGQFCLWVIFVILTIWRAYSLMKSMIKAETIGKYILQRNAERAITKSLLATMMVNRLQDTPHVSVPEVSVSASLPKQIEVRIEKLAGMYEIDRLSEDINASFRGKLSDFAVVSSRITDDGLFFKFVLEDMGSDKIWRPKNLKEMRQGNHVLKLQEGLTVNLADNPHIIVWGKSGSGKSSLLQCICLELFLMGAKVYFIDPKDEFSSFKGFYPGELIADETELILRVLRAVSEELKKRQRIVRKATRERGQMGLRAYDIGLKPIVVIADEIGSAVASMDSKQKKEFLSLLIQIVQKGRSVSVFCIVATQSPKTDTTLPSDIRSQFATKILLGSANGETQRMAFDGEVATKGGVDRFHGFYISDGKTDENPLSFAVPNLHANGLNKLENFKKAYANGSRS